MLFIHTRDVVLCVFCWLVLFVKLIFPIDRFRFWTCFSFLATSHMINKNLFINNSRHSHAGTPPKDARLHLHQYVNIGSPLDIREQAQWENDKKQQLIDSDKHEYQLYKELDLVIYLTLVVCSFVHNVSIVMIWMNHLSLMWTEHVHWIRKILSNS